MNNRSTLLALVVPMLVVGFVACGDDGPLQPPEAGDSRGMIFVNNDEWATSDVGFARAPDAERFVQNLAAWFTGGGTGSFLAYSENFSMTGSLLADAMVSAGHSWTVSVTEPFTLANLSQYDGVFLAATVADNQVLIDYVAAGGNVYLAGGAGTSWFPSAAAEAGAWNTFLNAYGLAFAPSYNLLRATVPIQSSHPVFIGVSSLYLDRGNPVLQLSPADPATSVLQFSGAEGLFATFEPPSS